MSPCVPRALLRRRIRTLRLGEQTLTRSNELILRLKLLSSDKLVRVSARPAAFNRLLDGKV
jgi:hypothetical protein